MYVFAIFKQDGTPVGLSRVQDINSAKSTASLEFHSDRITRVLSNTRYESHMMVTTLPTLSELDAQLKDDGITPEGVPINGLNSL